MVRDLVNFGMHQSEAEGNMASRRTAFKKAKCKFKRDNPTNSQN
jgi:hypothetical protein